MTARILVVDDIIANVLVLQANLCAEYYDVLTAEDGKTALEIATAQEPDLILLDIMMPGMDGFEVVRRLKADRRTRHIPVIMVTALDQTHDKVRAFDSGADDFLIKPVDEAALLVRVRNLLRMKTMLDEWRCQETAVEGAGSIDPEADAFLHIDLAHAKVLAAVERDDAICVLRSAIPAGDGLTVTSDTDQLMAGGPDHDLVIVDFVRSQTDALRLVSQLRSTAETRHTPILVLADPDDRPRIARALDMGVNDYLLRPLDTRELAARARAQIRRKRYQDLLRSRLESSLAMAARDALTGLFNRRYMERYWDRAHREPGPGTPPAALLLIDIDFFKRINDTHGHSVGDDVLRQTADVLANNVRGSDLVCRYGGEEFAVLMSGSSPEMAQDMADRLRSKIAGHDFVAQDATPGAASDAMLTVPVTVSIGVASQAAGGGSLKALIDRADQALYAAKRNGRNQVIADAA